MSRERTGATRRPGVRMFFIALLAPLAFADIGPPWRGLDPCMRATQEKTGLECRTCGYVSSVNPSGCERALAPEGYGFACKTKGDRRWVEVWCRSVPPPPPPPPDPAHPFGRIGGGGTGVGGGYAKPEPQEDWVQPAPAPEPAAAPAAAIASGAASPPVAPAPPAPTGGWGCSQTAGGPPLSAAWLTLAALALRRRRGQTFGRTPF